jgi:hypothetical protein
MVHLGRIPENRLSKTIKDYQPSGRRNISRPCKRRPGTVTDVWPILGEQKVNKGYCCVCVVDMGKTSGSHGDDYEDDFLLECCSV